MPATFQTTEEFAAGVTRAQMEGEQQLRLKAGAITSVFTGSVTTGWTLTSNWNVIGEQ